MKVVITGGSGQLGTVVLRRLLRDRTIKQVVNIDLKPPALPGHKLESIRADVRDPDIGRHFAGCDALIHLAFVVTQFLPREEVDSINIGGSRNVFNAAAAAGLSQIIYSSSIAAYGVVPGHKLPLTEDAPRVHQPDFAYAATKFQVEAFLDEFERAQPAIAIVRMRPTILIGREMEHQLGTLLKNRVMVALGGGPMPIVWDEDVADAIMLALRQKAHGAFNLTAEELLPSDELARAGGLHLIHLGPQTMRIIDTLRPILERFSKGPRPDPAWLKNNGAEMRSSSAKARAVLGWQPKFPTAREVIRHYVESVPKRLDARLAAFFRLLAAGDKQAPRDEALVGMNERVHLLISGPGGGDVALLLSDCRLRVEFSVPKPPTAVVRISDRTLLDLLAGRADLGAAQLSGKIQVDGEPRAAMILGGILARFQQANELPGVGGLLARGLQTWLRYGAQPASAQQDAAEETSQ